MLLSDRPIVRAAEDQFGLQPFAATLAKGLREMTPAAGMVVALHAPWGSGKTSALNLVQRHLSVLDIAELTGRPVEELTAQSAARGDDATEEERELARCWSKLCHHHREQCRTTVVRFNPWFFSGQENLFKAFFGVLGTELSIANDTAVATAVAAVLKRGAEAGAALGAAAGLAAAGPPGAIGGATVAGFFGKLLNDQFDKNESLEASLQRLREALQRSDKRLVVIVDDIDRLMPDELRHMLALVKSLGNLPNITYVLAYDFREVVKLLKLADIHSADYLDKIVQVSFDLPSADRYSLREMLFSKLEAIRRGKELEDPRRWQNAYFTYIDRYLKTPRDVTRLCNSLQVIWPSVEGEVDWTDLVVLQTLRLHEPSLHANIVKNLDLLTGEEYTVISDKDWAKGLNPTAEIAQQPQQAKEALTYLFPRLAKTWNTLRDVSDENTARRARRLSSPDYARNYFTLAPAPDQFSSGELRSLFDAADYATAFATIMSRARGRKTRKGFSMVSRLLEQLTEEINPRPLPVGLAHAILSQSDEIIRLGDEDWSLVRIDNGLRLDWLLVAALRAALPENRAAMICSWLDGADGTLDLAAFTETLTGKNARNSGEDILPADAHGMLREKAIDLMARSAEKSGLLKRADCGRVLFAWVRLTNYETVSDWLKTALANDDAVIDLATVIPDEVRSSNKGIYYVVNRDAWSKLFDLDEYSRRLHAIGARDPANKMMADTIAKFDGAIAHEAH